MAFDIVIGTGAPSGFDIVIVTGGGGGGGGGLISFPIPPVPIGTHLLALIVRDDPVTTPSPGWSKVIDGLGAGGLFLDAYIHEIDASDANLEADDVREVVFASVPSQELQGYLLALDNTSAAVVVEASASASFAADATPDAPASTSQQAINTVIGIWSASGAIDFDVPTGFVALDEYTTNEIAERSILIARKTANATGAIGPFTAAADPAATGRAWTVVLRNGPPSTPPELADPVPGHIGLI